MKKLISIIAGLALLCLSACSFGAGNAAVQEGACSIGLPTRNADGQPIGKFNFKVVLAPQFESEVFDDLLVWAKLVKEESNESGKTIIFREIPCGKYIAAVSAESADDTSLKYAGYSEEFEIKPGENTKVSINLIKVPVSTEDDDEGDPSENTIFIGSAYGEIPDETLKFNPVSNDLDTYILMGNAYVSSVCFSGEGEVILTSASGILRKDGSITASPAFTNVGNGKITFSGNANNPLKLGGLSSVVYQAPFIKNQGSESFNIGNTEFSDYNTSGNSIIDSSVITALAGTTTLHNVSFNSCKNMYRGGDQNEEIPGYQIAISQSGLLGLGKLSSDNTDGIKIYYDNATVTADGGPFILLLDNFADTDCPVTFVCSSELKFTPFICANNTSLSLLKDKFTLITADGKEYSGAFEKLFSIASELKN